MPLHAMLPLWENQSAEQKLDTMRAMIDDLYRYTLRDAFAYMRYLLHTYDTADDKEAADIAIMLRLMDKHPLLFSPLCEAAHFTGSALVLDQSTGRILLHYHKTLQRWLQFGGHAEHETDMSHVALRETQEETGLPNLRFLPNVRQPRPIDVDVHTIPASKGRPEHLHLDLRYVLITATPDDLNIPADESRQLRWFNYDELDVETLGLDPSLRRLIDKAYQRFQEQ